MILGSDVGWVGCTGWVTGVTVGGATFLSGASAFFHKAELLTIIAFNCV